MVGYKSIKMDLKLYINDIFSLLMSLFCCFGLYKYRQTNNVQWFNYIWYFFIIYLVYDLYSDARIGIDMWIHHICSIILTLTSLVFPPIPFSIIESIFTALVIESSSILLSIKTMIRTYLKHPTTDLTTDFSKTMKKIYPVNDLLFVALFTYTRIYLFSKNILFTPDLYSNLEKTANFWMLDKIIISCFWILGFLNIYWFSIIAKKTINMAVGYNVFEYKPDTNDPFLKQIEEIKNIVKT